MLFDSVNCKFCAPTSMTSSRAVAESFSQGFGVILTLGIYDLDLRYFDCSWLSNYTTEEEKLFIGGYESIRINSVIVSRLGEDYENEMKAIGIIQNMFDARHNPTKDEKVNNKTINTITNLLINREDEFNDNYISVNKMKKGKSNSRSKSRSRNQQSPIIGAVSGAQAFHEHVKSYPELPIDEILRFDDDEKGVRFKPLFEFKRPKASQSVIEDINSNPNKVQASIPEYVKHMFDHFCDKWTNVITIDIWKFNNSEEYAQFKSRWDRVIVSEDNCYVAIDFICKLFPNVNGIYIENGFRFTSLSFKKIFDTLMENKGDVFQNLNEIRIENCQFNDKVYTFEIQKYISQVHQEFRKKLGWEISYIDPNKGQLNDSKIIESNNKPYVVMIYNDNYDNTPK